MESNVARTQRGVTYAYESLLDEHFQHLVQSLLVKEFPGLQCTPVGMPDGGRDAFTAGGSKLDVVVQVKFSRNPSALKDPYEWITSAIDGERAKIDELIERGAKKYFLATNVPGTSHLDGGLIDKVNKYLNKIIGISAQCLWRDDLDRRLDGEYDIKLRYPHLLNGPDFLRLFWEESRSRVLLRNRGTIETYLKDQYKTDEHLRFKQVEMLTTKLFDLYVDVPIFPIDAEKYRHRRSADSQMPRAVDPLSVMESVAVAMQRRDGTDRRSLMDPRPKLGAATLLSDPLQLTHIRKLVLEGAPGQGKTTLSQYLAQIQRARYLGKQEILDELPAEHTRGPAFLPLKIELRDLALWLNGRDPWSPRSNTMHGEIESLESSLAAHIRRYSGGNSFDVEDLRGVISTTPTLLILDALDEVADLDDRKTVIAEIDNAIERLSADLGHLVVLVTSRPTAISSAPRLDRSRFPHYSLQPIHSSLALSYAKRWSHARGIPLRDALELQSILQTKLDSTHLAELAKNTMQLTILLSLVLSRGTSLPDKRTELYSAYLEQFLSRESDKSTDVRENRALIMDLHGYLAYYLHARAEGQRTTGRISSEELEQQVRVFLEREGHDVGLQEKIFHAVVQRVVALVSRVEGTFEFEVQPLREYFVARHLYLTAPYSPTGQERSGTKPDRFDGIAPNPYWMNVTRFYAGFFSKGELMDLAHRVCELIANPKNKFSRFPRRLALALLQDWVFSQVPRAVKMVVEALLDDDGLIWISNSAIYPPGRLYHMESEEFQLWPGGGGAEYAADIFWDRILSEQNDERSVIWCSLMRSVSSERETLRRWIAQYNDLTTTESRTRWLRVADRLRLTESFGAVDFSRFLEISSSIGLPARALAVRRSPRHFHHLPEDDQKRYIESVLSVGSCRPIEDPVDSEDGELSRFLFLSHPVLWEACLVHGEMMHIPTNSANDDDEVFQRVNGALFEAMHGDLAHSLMPWEAAVAVLDDAFGCSLTSIELACMSAAIRSSKERGKADKGLLNSKDVPLPKRFRYARRQANKLDWWRKQFGDIENQGDVQTLLLGLSTWAAPATVVGVAPLLDDAFRSLPDEACTSLIQVIQAGQSYSKNRDMKISRLGARKLKLDDLSLDTVLLLSARASEDLLEHIVDDLLVERLPNNVISRCVFPVVAGRLSKDDTDVESKLNILKLCAQKSNVDRFPFGGPWRMHFGKKLLREFPYELVIEAGLELPPQLVSIALEAAVRSSQRKHISVLKLAVSQGWFDNEIVD
jgi:hypothetical protein